VPQPVKISDTLIEAAREAAPLANRSLAAQVEHWAALGRAIEGSLTADQSVTLKRAVHEPLAPPYGSSESARTVRERVIDAIGQSLAPGFRSRMSAQIAASASPTYGMDDAYPGHLVRRDPDGTLTPGRLQGREFVSVTPSASAPRAASARNSTPPRTRRPLRQRSV
jgi:hypothetical protein